MVDSCHFIRKVVKQYMSSMAKYFTKTVNGRSFFLYYFSSGDEEPLIIFIFRGVNKKIEQLVKIS